MGFLIFIVALGLGAAAWYLIAAKVLAGKSSLVRHGAGLVAALAAFLAALIVMAIAGLIKPAAPVELTPAQAEQAAAREAERAQQVTARDAERAQQDAERDARKAGRAFEASKDKTLKEIAETGPAKARTFAESYAAMNGVDEASREAFYLCLGDYIGSKDGELKAADTLGWCLNDFKHDPAKFVAEKSRYDYFKVRSQFSAWDGSSYKVDAFIKSTMENPDSYKHVSTRHRVRVDPTETFVLVDTTFRGTNAFGGVVTNEVRLKVDPATGDVLDVLHAQ
ncbi:hypothetical protein ACLB90_03150 [Stenotrophomonas sp. LGBM10]|uniref:hypothetical protein n=1 Tax=Stenotrophomonas sp. LGBM10 TaxID=3390038 RepID=UPI00398B06C9